MLPNARTTRNEVAASPGELEGLVVASGRSIARPLVDFLKGEGLNVQIATSTEAAFEDAILHRPAAIIIDEGISPSGGVDLCERLKSHPRTHFLPTIVCATGKESQRLRALAAGADAVFVPTVEAEERRARLWALLRSQAMHRRAEKKREAQSSSIRARRRWVRNLVHDLQGSIGAVQANFEFMSQEACGRGPASPELQECMQDARSLFQELSRGLRTVLAFERFESEAVSLREKPVLLGDVVQAARTSLAWIASMSGISITVDDSAQAQPVHGDAEYLREAVANLIAFTLRQPGNRQCRIRISSAGGLSHLSVAGDRARIPAESRERIFEPYASPGKQAPVGHGLGLALARVIVEVHGGSIWVEDVPRAGSAFVVELPSCGPSPRLRTIE